MAKILMMTGVLLLIIGALLHFAPWTLNWFGRLPGDIRIQKAQGEIFIPLTSMLIVSVLLSLLVNLFRRW